MISFILEDTAKLPKRGAGNAAGLDIHCMNRLWLAPNSRQLIETGVTLAECPDNVYLRVAPRSKLANKYGLDVLAGVVDCDYRGEIGVILHNTSNDTVQLPAGSAIAQLIPEVVCHYPVQAVTKVVASLRGVAGIHDKELRL